MRKLRNQAGTDLNYIYRYFMVSKNIGAIYKCWVNIRSEAEGEFLRPIVIINFLKTFLTQKKMLEPQLFQRNERMYYATSSRQTKT